MPSSIRPLLRSQLRPLLWFIAFVMAVVVCLLLFFLWSARQAALQKTEVAVKNYAKILQVRLDSSLQRIESILRISAKQFPPETLVPGVDVPQAPALNAMLDDQIQDFYEFAGLRVSDVKGDLRYASGPGNKHGVNSVDRDFFIEPRDNPAPHLYFSKVIVSRITNREAVVISQGLRDPNGRFYGIISGGLALDRLQQQFRQLHIDKDAGIFLRRADSHALVTRWPPLPELTNQPLPSDHPVVLRMQAGENEFSFISTARTDHITRIVAIKRLEHYPFYVGVALGQNDALAEWRKQAWVFGLCASGLLLLMAGLMRHLVLTHHREIAALSDLAKNQARVRLLAKVFEYSGEAIILLDHNQQVLEVNAAYCSLTGNTIDDVRDSYWRNQFADLPNPNSGPHVASDARIWQGELICTRKDGSRFVCLHTSSSIHGENGETEYIVVSFTDISDRKRIEQLKSEFVSTVSHELRTPLTSISGALGLIVGGALGEPQPKQKALLTIAHQNSLRLSLLINDLLDMEKLAAGKMALHPEKCLIMPLVEAAIESNQAYAQQRGIQFRLCERVDGVHVQVDANRLQQVLSNLLSNAAKFSPEQSVVELAVRCQDAQVRVEVIDHGSGVPTSFHARIFEKFAQADSADTRKQGGTGLGLAISKELIEQMGGTIGFVSTPGGGATFYFELPVEQ